MQPFHKQTCLRDADNQSGRSRSLPLYRVLLASQEKAVRYWQFASVVVEGGEARTVNLCKQCYD